MTKEATRERGETHTVSYKERERKIEISIEEIHTPEACARIKSSVFIGLPMRSFTRCLEKRKEKKRKKTISKK